MRAASERRERIVYAVACVQETKQALRAAGLEARIITGAGTGTYEHEAASHVYNELQPGSYVFMDADYARNLREDGGPVDTFQHALFVQATVMSAPAPERRVIDAGLKTFAVDSGMPTPWKLDGAVYQRPSDEHGNLDVSGLREAAGAWLNRAAGARPLRPDRQPARLVRRHPRHGGQRPARGMRLAGGGAGGAVLNLFRTHCESVICTRYHLGREFGRNPMTPDERQLINGLFDRMRAYDLPQKDREAEALINQAVRATPDAPYMLVQSVLVQEQALEAANARVQELEARVRELEGAQPQQGGGSFLGGLFGGARPDPERRSSSVPAIGSRAGGLPSMLPGRPQPAPGGGATGHRRLHALGHDHGGRRGRRHAAGGRHPRHDGRRQRAGKTCRVA